MDPTIPPESEISSVMSSLVPRGLLIGNQFQDSADETVFTTVNPYTQQPICSIARGKEADINKAVLAAQEAFGKWRDTTPQERGKLLSRLADLIDRDVEILAKLEVSIWGTLFIAKQLTLMRCFSVYRWRQSHRNSKRCRCARCGGLHSLLCRLVR